MRVMLPIIWHDLTRCIARAFEEEGHTVHIVDWIKRQPGDRRNVDQLVIEEAEDFKPDFAFCQFQRPNVITPRLPKTLKELGCFSVNWSGDVRFPLPDWYKECAHYFSVTSFTNYTDVEEVRGLGCRSEFLQIGYDERIYYPGSEDRSGVVFLGNNYGGYKFAESEGRRQMVHALHNAFGDRFKVYGMSWEAYGGKYIKEPGDADILRGSSIAVGWDHFHRPGFASDRLLRATACGCALVNQYYEGIEEEHPHVIAVRSVEEMVDEVRKLLEEPELTAYLGKLNAENTLKNHRWNERVNQMMAWL